MDYTTKSYHSNSENADNNYDVSEEYADDFIVETAEEFENSPEEFVYGANNNSPEDEQAATIEEEYTYLTTDDVDNNNKNNDVNEYYENARPSAYDTESANEFEDEADYDASTVPSEEQAATIDEWYTTDRPSARERCRLDDYEIISDVLGSEKQLVKLYSTALCEASEEPFRNIIRENLDSAAADQYKTFEFMQKRGMYPTEQAAEQDVTQAKQQFTPLCQNNCSCNNCGCGDN